MRRYIIIAVIVTMVPATFMTYDIVKESFFKNNVNRFINDRLENTGTRIISYDINKDSLTLRVIAVGKELSDSVITDAGNSMSDYKLGRYRLQVIQGTESDSVMMLSDKLASLRSSSDNYAAMLHEESAKNAHMQNILNEYTKYESMAPEIAKEMKTLFPQAVNVSLSIATEAAADTTAIKKYVMAVVGTDKQKSLSHDERNKISRWLEMRLGVDTIKLVVE